MTHPDPSPGTSSVLIAGASPATLARRLGARVIDLGVWIAVILVLNLATIKLTNSVSGRTPTAVWITGVWLPLWSVAWLVLPGWRGGITVGKRLCRIQVVRTGGGPLTLGRALLREIFIFLSVIIPMIGVLNALAGLNDPRRQGLHDKLIDTLVVDRP